MGKQSANEGFLKAYVTHSGQHEFNCYASQQGFQHFTERVRVFAAPRMPITRAIAYTDFAGIERIGSFYIPSVQIDDLVWQRRRYKQQAYSICGLTHTTASETPMATMRNVVFGPTQPWDALICTSQAVRESCEYTIQTWCEYFRQRFGAPEFKTPLKLPVIPLGVDTAQYADSPRAAAARSAWRKKLGISDDAVAFLFVGRLAAHAKAHPVATYTALEQAARRSSTPIHLIQAGWFANQGIEKSFKDGANATCPSVRHVFLDGRQKDVREQIWSAADVFISLSDNIQETFGLTPIEAMAAGLPVVCTDWDGYKDTVRHGVDGLCVPTLAPPPGFNHDIAYHWEIGADTYDHYIANCCQITSVDIAACTRMCLELIARPERRREMGASGRRRAQDVFDWKHVIKAYQELWAELDAIRRGATAESVPVLEGQPYNPLRNDPFTVFASYPTETLRDDSVVRLRPDAKPDDCKALRALLMNNFGRLPAIETIAQRLAWLQKHGECTVAEFVAEDPEEQRNDAANTLLWSAKVGLISIGRHNADE
jgi:glycosyltransferase involved in cell wall biosynthesis